eukprot:TRINITY_DN39240_c0_g1_i1.p1 TRINITY_DN39240_c0_g1~~TRINITY_DN39240_c0_g1_i1.p1  ORF type:complete len:144 (+),score=37.62 TRINITY_DN39240_c0_g1_i1:44-475(+)
MNRCRVLLRVTKPKIKPREVKVEDIQTQIINEKLASGEKLNAQELKVSRVEQFLEVLRAGTTGAWGNGELSPLQKQGSFLLRTLILRLLFLYLVLGKVIEVLSLYHEHYHGTSMYSPTEVISWNTVSLEELEEEEDGDDPLKR